MVENGGCFDENIKDIKLYSLTLIKAQTGVQMSNSRRKSMEMLKEKDDLDSRRSITENNDNSKRNSLRNQNISISKDRNLALSNSDHEIKIIPNSKQITE